ncbi:MAG: acetyltransferase [Arcobacter sp.]|uniref:acetyltransferase n=1 Tax=uncultured Arcobacter sp. TaxID=165434 RepID=UPI000CAA5A6F|nr:acetyltransferase [uncultured Arcobacter sp.]PLY10146.1 MAG: acetyltransferase [Arcobacter sp.]
MYKIESLNIKEKKVLTKEPNIDSTSTIKDCSFGEYIEIASNNNIQDTVIDDYSYTSEHCQIIHSTIKKFVNIASYVRLNPSQHPMSWASQHHMQYRKEMFGFGIDDESFFDWRKERRVEVGNDVWIGHNVVIMGDVTVGDGAGIGSSSVVTKDIPPFAIVVGNPARIIRYRFDEKTIEALKTIAWWDWDYEKIKNSIDDFKSIELFIEKYKK